jgi:hypothetical protein
VDHDALGGERPKVRAAADLHGSMARPASPGYEDGRPAPAAVSGARGALSHALEERPAANASMSARR